MATYTKPLRPYLFNCYYQWMVDNNPTKIFIQVNAGIPLVRIPKECSGFTQTDGTVVFNISPTAVKNFEVGEDSIFFKARFSGIVRELEIPFAAILSIYSQQLKFGTDFPHEQYYAQASQYLQVTDQSIIPFDPLNPKHIDNHTEIEEADSSISDETADVEAGESSEELDDGESTSANKRKCNLKILE